MADWSHLPRELLQLIAERLRFTFYLLRFRSVCSSWRSSVSLLPHPLPAKFPVFSNVGTSGHGTFCLSKRTLFLVYPPPSLSLSNSDPHPWLIKIEDVRGQLGLHDPLSRYPIKPLPRDFPRVMDVHDLPVVELGQEYVLNDFSPLNSLEDAGSLYLEKVVFMWLNSKSQEFALLTIHVSGKLALFKSGDKEWTIIPDMPTPYDDVCVFQGQLYAVDGAGRTVVVGLDSSVRLVAEPVFGGDKKFLVESDGQLLLVDKYLSFDYQSLEAYDGFDDDVCFGCEQAVKFKVFRLNEEGKEWVELKSLGDRVVFLGDDCAFSSSASDLFISEGNRIIFRDDYFNDTAKENGLGVFELDDDRISPISDYPGYCKLFWPAPDWLRLPRLRISKSLSTCHILQLLSLSISDLWFM
ncbi:F-box protein SKIP23 isoform X1 [Neltuma alba]|uniref:F-box protein SKIP23 isoform X1 n=1 Tax=Neltuma alba TaxID=207710 RepID=UPI0010A2AE02|nr:F-box protein SKIP23-like isoform X1 [Prosopis alba]